MSDKAVADFIGFEDWPSDKLVKKILDLLVHEGCGNKGIIIYMNGMRVMMEFVKGMVDREDDIVIARSKISGWKDAIGSMTNQLQIEYSELRESSLLEK